MPGAPLEPVHTAGAMARLLWRLAWPLVITLQLASLIEAIVVFWLGNLAGPSALATEATLRYAFLCATIIVMGVAMGGSVLVAQSVGARDGRATTIIGNAVVLALLMWAIAVVGVLVLGGPIGDALASPQIDAGALRAYYLPWLLLTLPGIAVVQVLLLAAGGAGWTRLSLARSAIDLVLTGLAVPLFVAGLGMGAPGAPIASGLAQVAVAVLLWRALIGRRDELGLGRGFRVDRGLWTQLLDIGMPPQIARLAMIASYAYLVQLTAADGRASVAALGIALTLMFAVIGLSSAVGRAVGIVAGQSIGARAWDRLGRVLPGGLVLAVGTTAALAVALAAFGAPLAGLFTSRAEVIEPAARAMRILACAVPFAAVSQVFLFLFTSLKISKSAGVLGIAADGVGIAFALTAPLGNHLADAASSIVVSNAVRAILYLGLWAWVARPDIRRRAEVAPS